MQLSDDGLAIGGNGESLLTATEEMLDACGAPDSAGNYADASRRRAVLQRVVSNWRRGSVVSEDSAAADKVDPSFFRLRSSRGDHSPYLFSPTKRSIDVAISLVLLVFFLPFLVIISAVVKIGSKGPILFVQQRRGLNKKFVHVLKFRTMVHRPTAPFSQACKLDPRVTWIGKLLRKTSIDELPQLINVLRGDMSLVGPRPHPIPLDERFEAEVERYDRRFLAVPGITGLAQVNGARGETPDTPTMQNRIDFDVQYIREASLLLDLKILLATLREIMFSPVRENVY